MPNPTTESERWFDEYLTEHGYTITVEPPLGVTTLPDRLVERAGDAAICEVKEFTTDAMQRRFPSGGSGFGSFSGTEWLLNVRRAIGTAARQLEPLADDARPLLIVLANPHGVIAEIQGEKLIESMYGDLTITIPINVVTGNADSEPQWTLGDGGRLAGERAPWVSAVAGLRRRDRQVDWEQDWIEQWKVENWPDPIPGAEVVPRFHAFTAELEALRADGIVPTGEYLFVDVVETISQRAVPLPRTLFDGPDDRRWIVNREASQYELLARAADDA